MTAKILERLPNLSVLVVGDICLDRWCTYDPSEAEPYWASPSRLIRISRNPYVITFEARMLCAEHNVEPNF